MKKFSILLVEDHKEECDTCRTILREFNEENNSDIKLLESKTLADAYSKLDDTIQGAIIDINLSGNFSTTEDDTEEDDTNSAPDDEGLKIISTLLNFNARVPIFVLTGTPNKIGNLQDNSISFEVLTKGEDDSTYDKIIEKIWNIHKTGIISIFGIDGKFEKQLNSIYKNNIYPNLQIWIDHSTKEDTNPQTIEDALLRYTLNHIVNVLDDNSEVCFSNEVYLYYSDNKQPKPGSIITNKETQSISIVLSPACDLAIRANGDFKTDHILLIELDDTNKVIDSEIRKNRVNNQKLESYIKNLFTNNKYGYYHYLPKNGNFKGGFLNFRKANSIDYNKDSFNSKFAINDYQIAPSFIKDIQSRFSSYYARQGQPDIDHSSCITEIVDKIKKRKS